MRLHKNILKYKVRMKNIIITGALILLATLTIVASDVEVRMIKNTIDDDKLIVDIQMRGSNYDFNLAGFNLRFYYDNKQLTLDTIKNNLPHQLYSTPHSSLTHINTNVSTGIIPFENHMDFVNVGTELMNTNDKGTLISTEWTTVQIITFDILSFDEDVLVVFAMNNMTDTYATAFVEVSEWLAPQLIAPMNVFDLANLDIHIPSRMALMGRGQIEINVAPNPTDEYLYIRGLQNEAIITIYDYEGRVIKKENSSSDHYTFHVGDLISGEYVVTILTSQNQKVERLIIM